MESNSVARTCTICSHPKLVNIDRQLLRGDMLNGIAHRFHVSPDAVGRHRRHMRTAMLKAQAACEKQDLVYGQTLIDDVKAIKADAERLQLEAEGRRDIRAALQAHHLPTALISDFPRVKIFDALPLDKKFVNDRIRFVVAHGIGQASVAEGITVEDLRAAVDAL